MVMIVKDARKAIKDATDVFVLVPLSVGNTASVRIFKSDALKLLKGLDQHSFVKVKIWPMSEDMIARGKMWVVFG